MRKRIFCLFLSMVFVMLNISESVYAEETFETVSEKSDNSKFEIEYVLNSDWGQGFNAQINVSSDVEIKDWTLEFDYARNITDIWDAMVDSHDGNHYVLKSKEYNTVIEANQRITIGFNGDGGEATDEITNVSLYSGDKKLDDSGEKTDEDPDENDNDKENVNIKIDTSSFEVYEYAEENCYIVNDEITVITGMAENAELIEELNYKIYDCLENVIKQGNIDIDDDNWTIEDAGLAIGYNRIEIEAVTEKEIVTEKVSLINTNAENMNRVNVDMEDSDGDGIPNYYEEVLGYDKNSSDTDKDGLNDYDEFLYTDTDSTKYDTDENGISDGEEDFDQDGLTNAEEIKYGTACHMEDTDGDGLTDYEEIMDYGTNPLVWDSDEDGIRDGLEIERGWKPLDKDSDGDGTPDGEEVLTQTITEEIDEDRQPGVKSVSVTFDCNGDIADVVSIVNTYGIDLSSQNVVGIVGVPIRIESDTIFKTAEITFEYDQIIEREVDVNQLRMMWYDEENRKYVLLEDSKVNRENNTVTYVTNHFSTYLIVDSENWLDTIKDNNRRLDKIIESGMTDKYEYTGHMYKSFEEGVTWDEARVKCEEMGGHLVTITSDGEQKLIESLMMEEGNKNSYWIGAKRNSNKIFDKWVTGEDIEYTHYKPGQPDNIYEDALSIYRNNNPGSPGECFGFWNDMYGNGERPGESFFGKNNYGYICEWDYVGLVDQDGDGLFDDYDIFYSDSEGKTFYQLNNGQIVYIEKTYGNNDIRSQVGQAYEIEISFEGDRWNCMVFDAYTYYGLPTPYIYVDGRKNKNGIINSDKMEYICVNDRFINDKYVNKKQFNILGSKFDSTIAGVHGSMRGHIIPLNEVNDMIFQTNLLLVGSKVWGDLSFECLCYYLYDSVDDSSKRKIVTIDMLVQDENEKNTLRNNYLKNIADFTSAISPMLKKDEVLYVASSPTEDMMKSIESYSGIISNRDSYGVFNDSGAVLTACCYYDADSGQYMADIKYYVIDYYDFEFPKVMVDLNAVGMACTYELFGVYEDTVVIK